MDVIRHTVDLNNLYTFTFADPTQICVEKALIVRVYGRLSDVGAKDDMII